MAEPVALIMIDPPKNLCTIIYLPYTSNIHQHKNHVVTFSEPSAEFK